MKADTFRLAAELLDPCSGCCYALADALGTPLGCGRYETPENAFLDAALKPRRYLDAWWYDTPVEGEGDVQVARSLGLLLCAELIDDGYTVVKGRLVAGRKAK